MATTQEGVTQRPAAPRESHRRARFAVVAVVVLLVALAAVIARLATERVPPLILHRTVAAFARFPGAPPALSWPSAGQAAVEVEGVGSLGTSGIAQAVPIASLAKVMTAYLTLERFPLTDGQGGFVMTVTAADVRDEKRRAALGQSVVPVRIGEQIDERQALVALLLPSANNVAQMLASQVAGNVPAFVALMNATARRLGMAATLYTDPSGFDDRTVSTATDQLALGRAAIRQRALAAIVDEPTAILPVVGRVANYDMLVRNDGYVGVKTGSDRAAGGCLIFDKHVSVGGRHLSVLGVVLGQPGPSLVPAAIASAQRLGDSAAGALRVATVLRRGEPVSRATSSDGRTTAIVMSRSLREIGWGGLRLRVHVTDGASRTQVRAGAGLATVTVRGSSLRSAPAIAQTTVGGPTLGWRIGHIL